MADEEVTSEGSPMEEDELELSLGPPNLRRNPAKSTLFMTVSGNLNLNLNLDLNGQIFDSVIQKRETQAMRRREARRKREEKRRAKNGGLSLLNDVVFERKAMESRSVDRERREKESDGDFAFQWRKTVTVDKEVSKTTSYQNGSYGSQNDVVFERKAMESRCVDRERREKESDGDFAFRWRKKVTVNDEVSKTMSYGNVGVFLMPCLVESESNIVNVLKEVVSVTAADGGGFNNCTAAPVAVKNCSGGETSGSGGSSCEVPDYQSTSGHGGSISSEAGSHSRHSSPSLRSPLKPGLASTSPESQPCQSPPQPQAQPQPGSSIGICPSPVKVDCEVDHMQNQNTTSTNLTHFQQSPETQIVSSDKNRNLTRTSSNQTHFQQPLRSQPVSPDRNPMLTQTASNPTHFRKSMGSQIASPNGNPNPNQMPSNQTHFQQPLKTQLVNLDKNPTMSQALSTLTHFQPQKARLASLDKNLKMMQTPSNQTHFEAPLKTQFTSLDKNTTLTQTASNPTHFQLQKTQVMSPDRNPRVDHMPSNLTQIQLPKTRSPSVEKSPTPDSRSPSGPLSHPENGDHKPPRVPSTSRAEKHILAQMPCVSATGNGPNGKTITGFLYRYTKSDVSIVCVCHGTSFSPAGFVEHAGGIDIEHPLRHIRVIPFPLS